MVALQSGHRF